MVELKHVTITKPSRIQDKHTNRPNGVFGIRSPYLTTKDVYYNNRVDVRGRKYVFGPTQAHFSPRQQTRAKMSSEKGQNIFTPKNINSITIIIISEGI